MGDETDVKFAIIPLRTVSESTQLRVLLRQNGYEEPIWLDSNGHPVSAPSATLSTPQCHTAPTLPWSNAGHFLTLPTVLTHATTTLYPSSQSGLASVALPLVPATPPSTSDQPSTSTHQPSSPPKDTPHLSPAEVSEMSIGPASAESVRSVPCEPASAETSGQDTWISQTPLRPRGMKPNPPQDPNVYYTCQLCKNKILGTRVSNLQNHARRHASMKQFKCKYCEYSHNEIAKVRLHMTNNHKDSESAPINNLTTDMQTIWRNIFRQCFPTRVQRRRGARHNPVVSETQGEASTSTSYTDVSPKTGDRGQSGSIGGPESYPYSSGLSESSESQPGTSGTSFVQSAGSGLCSVIKKAGRVLPLAMRRRRHLQCIYFNNPPIHPILLLMSIREQDTQFGQDDDDANFINGMKGGTISDNLLHKEGNRFIHRLGVMYDWFLMR